MVINAHGNKRTTRIFGANQGKKVKKQSEKITKIKKIFRHN